MLFLNGSVLEFVEDAPIPVLVSLAGDTEGVGHFMDLAKKRFDSDVFDIGATIARRFMPRIEVAVREYQASSPDDESGVAMAIGARLAGEIGKPRAFLREMLGATIQGAVTLSQGATAYGFEALLTRRIETLRNSLSPGDYEDMVRGLHRLQLIEPRLRVALCGSCGNYEFVVSTSSRFDKSCSKCGHAWAVLTLFVFKEPLDRLKREGHDLSLFVSAFLRSKTKSEFLIGELEVYPMARFGPKSGPEGEIDVWVPCLRLGIEAKTYEDALAPFTRRRVGQLVDNLDAQIVRYRDLGVKSLGLVTNLSNGSAARLQSALADHWHKKGQAFEEIVVVPGNPEPLINYLTGVAKKAGKKLQREYEARIRKNLGPATPVRHNRPRLPAGQRSPNPRQARRAFPGGKIPNS